MYKVLALDAWKARLKGRGHPITVDEECKIVDSFSLEFPPETIITVALEADWPAYRGRYYVCEPEPQQIFGACHCPDPHRSRWVELVSQQPPSYWQDFLAGPGSWTLTRLARFDEVVFWSNRGADWSGIDHPFHRGWGMQVPDEAAPFFPTGQTQESYQPRLVSVHQERFADIIVACFLSANVGLHDCYIADAAGTEVYFVMNDEMVLVSIPDSIARAELVRDLEKTPRVFRNVSGYTGSTDDEGEDEKY